MVCVVVGWLSLAGCGDDNNPGNNPPPGNPTLQSISINAGAGSVQVGQTLQLSATGSFSDQTTQDLSNTVTWSSSAPAEATVSATGLVTGVAVGNVTITATSGTTSATATVTVSTIAGNKTVDHIDITPVAPTVTVGDTVHLVATATFSDQTTQDVTMQAAWSSAAGATATVDGTGLVTAVAIGSTTITAALDGVDGTTTVTVAAVVPKTLVSIKVSPLTPSITVGGTLQFTATGTFSDQTTADVTARVIWRAEDNNIAKITEPGGLATGLGVGKTNIVASTTDVLGNTLLDMTELTVTAGTATLASIAIGPATPSASIGKTLQLSATGTFSDNTTVDVTTTSAWASDNEAVATVDPATGLVTALAAGTANITATKDGVVGTTVFTANVAALTDITVSPGSVSLKGGETQQFTAMGTFDDGSQVDITATVSWSSSVKRIATIGANTGLATGVAFGQVTITASKSGKQGTATLNVAAPSVLSTTPADGDTDVDLVPSITITFDQAVAQNSLTTQTSNGPCTKTVQLSADDFVTCIGFQTPQPALNGNTINPRLQNVLDPSTTYKIKVAGFTTAVGGTAGTPFAQPNGFTTAAP